ncbi:MAG: SDR family NAD(P)-dependent oxidoreductase [Pseudomonadales bacterium]|nr:SDR family NAD(P)-dependent oxidoreductase [Pseudomonadales bacterium]
MSRGTVLITGASSGIGEAIARKFHDEGFDLIITARREDRLEALKSELSEQNVTVIASDLSNGAGIDAFLGAISAHESAVDIVVNNAGMMVEGAFTDLTDEDVAQTIGLNITALTRITQQFARHMQSRGHGRITNIASVAAFHPVPGMDLYAATKAYVLSLSESLSENLRGSGVSVTTVCPGMTKTDMVDTALAANLPPFMMSSSSEVAKETFDAVMSREVLRIPGAANQVALTWAQHQPRWLVRGIGGLAARILPKT